MKYLKTIGNRIEYISKKNTGVFDKIILKQIRRDKNIIYGAQSIKKQIGYRGRPTEDYDTYSNTPKKSAIKIERKLDKVVRGDQFYVKPAKHAGTWKVNWIGLDMKKGTRDDKGWVDYTEPEKVPKYVTINNIRYRALIEELKAKEKALADPTQKFRHSKDLQDAKRIRAFLKRKSL